MEKHIEDISSLIELYALGELDENKISIVEEHLRRNPDALREVEDIRRITAALAGNKPEEPPVRLAEATKSAVYSLMERDSRRIIIPFIKRTGRVFTKPAFAAAAALIAITVCLIFIFNPNKHNLTLNAPNGDREISPVRKAATVESGFIEYITHSADVFDGIPMQNSDDFKKSLDMRQLDIEIGNAMKIRENERIAQDAERLLLVSDIESVWRNIKGFAEDNDNITFETIKSEITEKDIVTRVRTLKTGN